MTPRTHARITIALFAYALLLTTVLLTSTSTSETKEVKQYIVCPDGQDTCTPYHPHEVKVIYQ